MKRALLPLLLLATGCGESRTRHVLVIGLDGVRADALAAARAPAMKGLIARGAGTFAATTQLTGVTKSGPGWASILTGVEVDKHRVVDNATFPQKDPAHPSMLKRARDAGLTTCAWVNWFPLWTELFDPEQAATVGLLAPADGWVTDETTLGLSAGECRLAFVHLDDVDKNGHATGFSTTNPNYMGALEKQDERIAAFLATLAARPNASREDWLVIVTTDHGGAGLDHGPKDAENRTIPFIVSGPGASGVSLAGASHLDVTPTALAWLGVPFSGDGASRAP